MKEFIRSMLDKYDPNYLGLGILVVTIWFWGPLWCLGWLVAKVARRIAR